MALWSRESSPVCADINCPDQLDFNCVFPSECFLMLEYNVEWNNVAWTCSLSKKTYIYCLKRKKKFLTSSKTEAWHRDLELTLFALFLWAIGQKIDQLFLGFRESRRSDIDKFQYWNSILSLGTQGFRDHRTVMDSDERVPYARF